MTAQEQPDLQKLRRFSLAIALVLITYSLALEFDPGKGVRPLGLLFEVVPLGSPDRQLHKPELATAIPSIRESSRRWDQLSHLQPTTVFTPSPVTEADWAVLLRNLADA